MTDLTDLTRKEEVLLTRDWSTYVDSGNELRVTAQLVRYTGFKALTCFIPYPLKPGMALFHVEAEEWAARPYDRYGYRWEKVNKPVERERLQLLMPKLRPLVPLHRASEDGVPGHILGYDEDWLYHFYKSDPRDFARTVRVDPPWLPEGLSRRIFFDWLAAQAPRWKAEAEIARRILQGA